MRIWKNESIQKSDLRLAAASDSGRRRFFFFYYGGTNFTSVILAGETSPRRWPSVR